MLNLQSYPDIMNIHEVAEVLHCSSKTVSKLCREGKIKAMKVGKGWGILQQSLEEFVSIQTNSAIN